MRELGNTNCGWEVGTRDSSRWWEWRWVRAFPRAVWQILGMLGVDTPSDPTIQLMGICPKEIPSWVHTGTCTRTLIMFGDRELKVT